MSSAEIDAYLASLDEPKRGTLGRLRSSIRAALPDGEEGISYGLPDFRVDGKVVAGFAAFKNHLSYVPHSGSVLSRLAGELGAYEQTKGSLHFLLRPPRNWLRARTGTHQAVVRDVVSCPHPCAVRSELPERVVHTCGHDTTRPTGHRPALILRPS